MNGLKHGCAMSSNSAHRPKGNIDQGDFRRALSQINDHIMICYHKGILLNGCEDGHAKR
jgi:hypothetical protein